MPLYLCDKCGVIENTALGSYWSRIGKEPVLCSECAKGEWHGTFEKEFPAPDRVKEIGLANFVSCERLREVFDQQSPEAADARPIEYPTHISGMPSGTRSQRKAKKAAKQRYLEQTGRATATRPAKFSYSVNDEGRIIFLVDGMWLFKSEPVDVTQERADAFVEHMNGFTNAELIELGQYEAAKFLKEVEEANNEESKRSDIGARSDAEV